MIEEDMPLPSSDDLNEDYHIENVCSSPLLKTETQLQREMRLKERDQFFESLLNSSEFKEAIDVINNHKKSENYSYEKNSTTRKRKRRDNDGPFIINTNRFFEFIGVERRQSFRLKNRPPIFTEDDLVDESSFKRRNLSNDDSDIEDLEEIVYKVRTKKHRFSHGKTTRPPIIAVEDITESMINNISKKVGSKKYSSDGTSCHQCRQKTADQKTCCRNVDCVGIRGQFCGVCLENRYGEDAVSALMNPNWHCPVCRGICNCSFCRAKAGKRPTGILTPLAHRAGHKSVKEFLDSLNGYGNNADTSKNPHRLLGFTDDLNFAQMGGDVRHSLNCSINGQLLSSFCADLEKKSVPLQTYSYPVLLGFKDNFALFSDSSKVFFNCSICKL